MCCIAIQPPGDSPIDKDTLARMWDCNHDGAGYMFAHDKKLIVRKPFFKLADLREAYAADHAAFGAVSNFVLHFRYSTHGKKDEINTHPHILAGGRAALVHNGILHDFTPDWKSYISDTVMFCAQVLAYRQPSQLTGAKFGRYLGVMIGDSNKLVIMDYTGKVQIVNESKGLWDGGRWYSNTSYLPPVALPPRQSFARLPGRFYSLLSICPEPKHGVPLESQTERGESVVVFIFACITACLVVSYLLGVIGLLGYALLFHPEQAGREPA